MLLSRKILRYIKLVLFALFISSISFSQSEKIKLDGVSAVVGDYVILESDIDKTLVEMKSQGIPTKGVTRCQLLGKLNGG